MGAKEARIAESHHWMIGEDRTIRIDVLQSDDVTPQAMTGWALTWELLDKRGGTVLLSKTTAAGGITIGNGDATDDRATIPVADTDLEAVASLAVPGTFFHVLRRTDAGSEAVLAFGDAVIQEASV